MKNSLSSKYDVLIIGAGVSASFAALRLLAFGFRPLIVARRPSLVRSAEAVPETVLRFGRVIAVQELLEQAGAVATNNFEIEWEGRTSFQKPGFVWHVDRTALARVALTEAVRRGATLIYDEKPFIPDFNTGSVKLTINHTVYEFRFAIDSTGRAARWSRPVRRAGNEAARLFRAASDGKMRHGKVVSVNKGWAYRIDLPSETTIGVIRSKHSLAGDFEPEIAERLELSGKTIKPLGTRPAFPQWTLQPCGNRVISVGDAAFAHNPIAGQGIRFALSSAVAASVVLRTCRDFPSNELIALNYYRDLVCTERQRHLSFLENLKTGSENFPMEKNLDKIPEADIELPDFDLKSVFKRKILFSAATKKIGVQRDELILAEEAVELKNGDYVRWLGRFDLLELKLFCVEPRPFSALFAWLSESMFSERETLLLLKWCLSRKVLSVCS